MTMRAIWNDTVLAETGDTVVVEGNHYFPRESLVEEYFSPRDARSLCPWKGMASYYTITVNGAVNPDAAWEYPNPSARARDVKGRVAFWHGVEVVADDASSQQAVSR
jgi:uncharacterized protein (DUF427 family)